MSARLLLVLALTPACVLDYDALRGRDLGTSGGDFEPTDGGVPFDAGDERDAMVEAPAEYAEVVYSCSVGWRHLLTEGFDGRLADHWSHAGASWSIVSGELVGDLGNGDDYWNRHAIRDAPLVEDLWLRVDVATDSDEGWPQVHLRVDPANHAGRFYGVRMNNLRNELALVRQSDPSNATNPELQTGFGTLARGTMYRWVITVRSDGLTDVFVRAGIYTIGPAPTLVPNSVVEYRYTGATAYRYPGRIALSGWEGVSRFDNLEVYECP